MLDNPWPYYITVPWVILITSCLIGFVYLRFKEGRTTIYGNLGTDSEETTVRTEEESSVDKGSSVKESLVEKKIEKNEKNEKKGKKIKKK